MKRQKEFSRSAGILLPVSSLPSEYGIGTFGSAAYRFVDFLKKAGQSYWQVLPLGPTGYGDSPYQSFSAFAGNPYFIDIQTLIQEGLLLREDAEAFCWGEREDRVDYQKLFEWRLNLLRIAFYGSRKKKDDKHYLQFCSDNDYWLSDYCRYMAFKKHYGGQSWYQWPQEIRMRESFAMETLCEELTEEINFWKFCQYHFFQQWKRLKEYANQNGIQIIGDIPIYVSADSADVWAAKEEFQLDSEGRPTRVAGVPPDEFSDDGQLWGNPLYNWKEMEKNEFTWWKLRMSFSAKMYDVIRIDHFIGIVRYYSIDAARTNAVDGKWLSGPGSKLIDAIDDAVGDVKLIAEDLGAVTPAVTRLRIRAGYPGMKLMQQAFDTDSENTNLPHHFEKNCVVYGGTHDNETLAGYFKQADAEVIDFARQYMNVRSARALPRAVIREAYKSTANLVIFQMQDILGLDNRSRMNRPSTVGGNWQWRVKENSLTDKLAEELYELSRVYGRLQEENENGKCTKGED